MSKQLDIKYFFTYHRTMTQDTLLRRQLFASIGLTDKEAIIYDLLLTHGEMGSGIIERESRLKKNTYSLLRSLQRKQLVSITIKDGKRLYVPSPPDQLLVALRDQKRALLHTQTLLETALPELQQAYQDKVGRPTVRYYSGLNGLRAVFDEVYKEGKEEVLSCFGNEAPDEKLYDEIINKYLPMRVKNNIFARTLSPDSPRARELKKTEAKDLKEKILIDGKKYPMPAEVDTWDDKIALMSFARKDFSAVLIDHKELATTLQSLMRLAMDLASSKARPK